MALPKIDLPIYELELPSSGEKVKYRPFTVKEEKILLTAQEADDPNQIILAIKQIVNNCLLDKEIKELAVFDIEYLLITLRSKSVDNKVEFEITDPDTNEKIKLELDLAEVQIEKDPSHTNKIKISEEYTLFLRYPTMDNFSPMILKNDQTAEESYDIMVSCLDKLASEDEVFNFVDFSKKEVNDFVESLHSDTIKKIRKFFDTLPKVRHEISYKNSAGDNKKFVIQGTESFFI
jgi:hypothetical protein